MRLPSARSLLPPLAAVLVALAGAVLLWQGLVRTDAFGGDATLSGRLPSVSQPVVVTAPGMPELAGDEFTVHAAAGAGRQVFVGVGRSDDVEAYLGAAARAEAIALEPSGSLRVAARVGEPSVPDPAGVDIWAAMARGTGTVALTWPRAPGRWRVLIAVDGRVPPSSAEFTWAGSRGSSAAPALIAVGAVLLVAGLAGLLAIRSGRMFASAERVWAAQAEQARRVVAQARADRVAARERRRGPPPGAEKDPSQAVAPDLVPGREAAAEVEPGREVAAEVEPGRRAYTPPLDDPDVGRPAHAGHRAGWTPGTTDDETGETVVIQPFRQRDRRSEEGS